MHKDVHKEAPAAENPGLEDLHPRRPPLSYPKSCIIDRVHEAKNPQAKEDKVGVPDNHRRCRQRFAPDALSHKDRICIKRQGRSIRTQNAS